MSIYLSTYHCSIYASQFADIENASLVAHEPSLLNVNKNTHRFARVYYFRARANESTHIMSVYPFLCKSLLMWLRVIAVK